MMNICSIQGCGKKVKARGWCNLHYRTHLMHGDPLRRIRRVRGTGGVSIQGYHIVSASGKERRAHVVVAEKALGHALPVGAHVHHVNEDKLDNRPENLVICPDWTYHKLIHQRMRALETCGNANWRKCPSCKTYDDPENMRLQRRAYWHRSCTRRPSP